MGTISQISNFLINLFQQDELVNTITLSPLSLVDTKKENIYPIVSIQFRNKETTDELHILTFRVFILQQRNNLKSVKPSKLMEEENWIDNLNECDSIATNAINAIRRFNNYDLIEIESLSGITPVANYDKSNLDGFYFDISLSKPNAGFCGPDSYIFLPPGCTDNIISDPFTRKSYVDAQDSYYLGLAKIYTDEQIVIVNNSLALKEDLANKSNDIEADKLNTDKYANVPAFINWIKTYLFSNLTAKSTALVDNDLLIVGDSEDAFKTKTRTFDQLKANLKTYFDTLYQVILVSGTNIKTINSNSVLGAGNLNVGTIVKTRKDITGTSYTIISSDYDKILYTTNSSPVTITVPSGLTINQEYEVIQYGIGQASFVTSGTTLVYQDYEIATTYGLNSRVFIIYVDTGKYELTGKLSMI